tara:strand:- start:1380 stop:1742 length:363 start_codon:yes stop_codon:yes gene_type:complete
MRNLLIITLLFITSCANIEERDKKRDLQSKIIRLISEKNKRYAACARENNIFKVTGKNRVKVDMQLTLNSDGKINKFEIINNMFADKFVDCMFNVTDLIAFPKLSENEVIELTQPFIFKK